MTEVVFPVHLPQARFTLTFYVPGTHIIVFNLHSNFTGVRDLLLSPLGSSRPQGAAMGGLSRSGEKQPMLWMQAERREGGPGPSAGPAWDRVVGRA